MGAQGPRVEENAYDALSNGDEGIVARLAQPQLAWRSDGHKVARCVHLVDGDEVVDRVLGVRDVLRSTCEDDAIVDGRTAQTERVHGQLLHKHH